MIFHFNFTYSINYCNNFTSIKLLLRATKIQFLRVPWYVMQQISNRKPKKNPAFMEGKSKNVIFQSTEKSGKQSEPF